MSRAFTKEDSGEGLEVLPDRPISPHPNYVTLEGLSEIEKVLSTLNEAYGAAQTQGDRVILQRLSRDLKYWTQRRQTAQVIPEPVDKKYIQFGSRFRLSREDGQSLIYRIVGEDEANPAKGTLSYVSPLAIALRGKGCGESVKVRENEFEIVEIL